MLICICIWWFIFSCLAASFQCLHFFLNSLRSVGSPRGLFGSDGNKTAHDVTHSRLRLSIILSHDDVFVYSMINISEVLLWKILICDSHTIRSVWECRSKKRCRKDLCWPINTLWLFKCLNTLRKSFVAVYIWLMDLYFLTLLFTLKDWEVTERNSSARAATDSDVAGLTRLRFSSRGMMVHRL